MAKIKISSFCLCYKSFGGVNFHNFVGISEKKFGRVQISRILVFPNAESANSQKAKKTRPRKANFLLLKVSCLQLKKA